MRVLLSDRRRLLFFTGNAISTMGDDALFLALAVWVKELTGSTALAAIDMCAVSAAALLAPLTGVVVDRVRRKPLLLGVYGVTAVLLLALLPVHRPGQVWLVIAVTFCYGLSGTVTSGAQVALLKNLVPDELLADANSLEQTLFQSARLITPALGVGLLARFGAPAVVWADIASFVIAALLLAAVRIDEPRPEREREHGQGQERWISQLTVGFRYLAGHPVLRALTLADAVAFLVIGMFVPFGLQVITVGLHHAPSYLAVMITVQSVAGALGAMVAGRLARRIGDVRLTILGLAGFAACCPIFAVPSTPVVLGAIMLLGCSLPWFFIGASTLLQRAMPLDMVGRVSGANSLAVQLPQALGNLSGAALILVLPYRVFAVLVGATVALTALYLGTRPALSSRSNSRKTGACMSTDVRSIASSSVTKLDASS
jgi:MFS family permease